MGMVSSMMCPLSSRTNDPQRLDLVSKIFSESFLQEKNLHPRDEKRASSRKGAKQLPVTGTDAFPAIVLIVRIDELLGQE